MTSRNKKADPENCKATSCSGCCGPVGFEIPDELMTPEMETLKKELGEKAFLEMMKKML
ncbi:MAG: hypothetical protein P1V18_06035 [Candidatus Gracilibacteria bacterium]|nr:hypothetical protein [Candidatus Gracilibacteria bacterium]